MRDLFQSLGRSVALESKDQRDTIASSAKRFINTENPAHQKKKKKKDMKGKKSQIQQSQQSEKDYRREWKLFSFVWRGGERNNKTNTPLCN